jgi:hypothetical protein
MGFYTDRGSDLKSAKDGCILEIESWYGGATLDAFDCNILGPTYRYECNEAAQLRFINGKVSNLPIDLMCGPVLASDQDPLWDWKSHSAVECGKVHSAYLAFSKDAGVQYRTYKEQLIAATTVLEVDAIWSALWG